ncbi:hypothetical protein Pmani_019985 [Petrolisthes manimaculis]|uniref:RING-type domain-containing protein n=1 Tax=Petrolisthes manimaculis TaxID=1843537 RepID=A0AAE1PHU1_9EUCA|nr:hypothetical protein Pmani_019985 [Petrolisthes manimaculis]
MNLQAQALSILDTALRVPPLFVMDEVLKCCFGFSNNLNVRYRYSNFLVDENPFLNAEGFGRPPLDDDPTNLTDDTHTPDDDDNTSLLSPSTLTKILVFLLVYMTAVVVFLLTSKRLQQIYLVVGSMATVVAGYQLNMATMQHLLASTTTTTAATPQHNFPIVYNLLSLNTSALMDSTVILYPLAVNSILQGLLGYLFTVLYKGPSYPLLHKLVIMSFLLPSLSVMFVLPTHTYTASSQPHIHTSPHTHTSFLLTGIPLCAALLPLAIIKYTVARNLMNGIEVVVEGYRYARRVMTDFGLHALLESEWVRLNVPNVLRTFWVIRVVQHVMSLVAEIAYARGDYRSIFLLGVGDVFVIFKSVMIQGCETAVALLGMTSVVSYVSHYVGVLFQMILLTTEDDERSMGTVCAILFFILAEQSGLTVMEGEKRFVRLCRNFCLLFTAMLHFIHNMVNPVLMSLSASCNPAMYRHTRALFVCLLLFSLPLVLLYILWSFYPLSTWLLAVSAFSIQVVVKTLVSVLIYSLFLVDAYRNQFWERLDDHVYYISAFGNSVEFVFGILLFFNGAWIYFFESGGSIRAFMMCVHAYFNIWCEAKNGWTVFMKRRTAVKKIDSLPEATTDQLSKHDDVCAICFQELQSARITRCNHYFHSVCLRKWLYVQDSCPLCHEILYRTESHENTHAQTPAPGIHPAEGGDEDNAHTDEQGEIDVIHGENMNTADRRDIVIDNEVGEAVIQRQEISEENSQENSEENSILRRRRESHIDEDIGQ